MDLYNADNVAVSKLVFYADNVEGVENNNSKNNNKEKEEEKRRRKKKKKRKKKKLDTLRGMSSKKDDFGSVQ